MNNIRPDQQQFVLKLRGYLMAREEAWEALLAALRDPSEERMKEFARKNTNADALLEDLNSG